MPRPPRFVAGGAYGTYNGGMATHQMPPAPLAEEIGLRSPITPTTMERFDRAFRRRITVAVAVSLVVNAVVFGGASLVAFYYIRPLLRRATPVNVSIRRVFLPADPKPAIPPAAPRH